MEYLRSTERILITSFLIPAGLTMSHGYLTADARSLQALAAILDYVTHLAPISCWYRSDAKQNEFRLFQAALL